MVEEPKVPHGAVEEKREGDVILAWGEVTGHAHRIASPRVRVWSAAGQRYIEVEEASELTHEEHGAQVVEPGVYRVQIQRTYTLGGEVRNVAD